MKFWISGTGSVGLITQRVDPQAQKVAQTLGIEGDSDSQNRLDFSDLANSGERLCNTLANTTG